MKNILMDICSCISKYRSSIMGFATIMVLLVHQYAVHDSVILDVFSHIGHWGVDIFLFVSGFGIAHSLSKNTKVVFFLNRLKKMLPICLVVGLFGLTIDILHREVDLVNLVPRLLCLDNWYVYTISIYYILSPYLFKIMKWKAWVLPSVVVVLSVFISVFSLLQPLSESTHFLVNKLPWAWDRFFIYLLGIYCFLKRSPKSSLLYIIGGIVFVLVVLAQYKVLPITHCRLQVLAISIPFVCYVISLLCRLSTFIENALSFFGKHSLSIFLLHLIVYSIGENHMVLIPHNGLRLFVEIAVAIILATIIDMTINKVLSFICAKHEKESSD